VRRVDVGSLVNLRVMVVEDENIVAKDIELTLRAGGHTVCGIASAGVEAVEMAERTRPDLVLMDIRLHGEVDGIEAARRIQERLNVPVVFLTAYADERTLQRAAAVAPYGYLLKPFDEKELYVTVLIAACKHRAFAELDERVRERADEIARSEVKYRQIEAVAQLGVFALTTRDVQAVIDRAIEVVAETLGTEFVAVFEVLPGRDELLLRAGAGWEPGLVGVATVGAERHSQGGYTLLSSEPVIVGDLQAEARFTPSSLLTRHGVVSGLSVVIHAAGAYGVLGAHTGARRDFPESDVHFLQAVANVLAGAIVRTTGEEQIRAADRVVAERSRQTDAERAAREVAEAANQAKDEFLAMLAHELRNPLAAIRSGVAVLDRLGAPGDRSARSRELIARQVAHLARVVDDLIDVSRAITGKIVLDVQRVDLADLVRRHVHTLRTTGSLEHHAIAVDAESAWVDGDPTRLEQIVGNLTLNAVKYTPAPGRIALAVGIDAGEAVLRVQDSGVGIPADLLPRVFDLFVQGTGSLDRAQGGLGVGLTLVRRLVELHRGTVKASSAGPGQGSVFTVRLPARSPLPVTAHAERVTRAVRPCRVLVVEDNRDARESLRQLLEVWGHEVHEADDGLAAIEIAAHWKPDVTLVDIGLPGADGYEVCRRLRSAGGGQATRVVAVTGYGQPDDRRRATDAGFNAHLVKPVDPDHLQRVIAELLG
jgi:signal transduction histidine kinase/DNA-binding response OmpR family regulator